jgi:pyrimidine operon attenuation protein / uracil phosphoribosyltransferase
MSSVKSESERAKVVMGAKSMSAAIRRLAEEIAEANPEVSSLALMGILRRGRPLADRLADHIAEVRGARPRVGSLATTLYRDDLRAGIGYVKPRDGETHFDFNVDGLTVVLVDDVLAAGRTIRAAMDEVMDYGRPARIQLACLVDRGGRELPIQPDYLGETIAARKGQYVSVRFVETDGEDVVILGLRGEEQTPPSG